MALLEEANRLQRGGAHAEAAAKYGEALRPILAMWTRSSISGASPAARAGSRRASSCLRRALTIDPRRAGIHNLLGMALARLGQPAEALASLDAALACDPDFVDAYGNRGDVLVELARHAEAIESYERALALNPDSIENWCNRGAALHDLHRYREAVESFDRVARAAARYCRNSPQSRRRARAPRSLCRGHRRL